MSLLARWSFHHRCLVVVAWLVVLAAVAMGSNSAGTRYDDGFSLPGTDSTTAMDLLQSSGMQAQSGDVDTIVFHDASGSTTGTAVRSRVSAMLATVARLPSVGSVRSPYTAGGATQISSDRHTAYAAVTFTKAPKSLTIGDVQPVVDAGTALRSSTLQVEFGGYGIQKLSGDPTSASELIGILAAAVVLLIAFGSALSMAIPLISAVFALGTAIETIALMSHVLTLPSIAPTVAALVGLGVGIDYALFILTRHRNGLRAGLTPQQASVAALNTAGRAVLFAGGTVAIAMLGLLILGVSFLTGIGIAAAVAVAFAVAAALTLLPAIFAVFGMRVLSRRERRELSATGGHVDETGSLWARWAGFVQRKPVVLSMVATVIMAALVIPAFSIRLGTADQGNGPAALTTRRAYDLLAQGFGPGYNGPLQLVAQAPTAADKSALNALVATLRTTPGVASVAAAPAAGASPIDVVSLTPTTSPQSTQTAALIDHLRGKVIPPAEAGTGLQVYLGGQTAVFQDFAGVLTSKLLLFITVVVLLGALLLMVAFRSILIPLTAAVMNLLAAGASFGVVVAVFQWGWGSAALGLGTPGPVEAFLPVMLLAILFGLSMDYQVFLVSRIHEEWVATGDNRRAVRVGQATTGRVITAAAAIMICVFLAFVLGGERDIGEFGVGLATAILLDALILRTVLVPAAMQLFGTANWWIPGWLDRALPHLSLEVPKQPHLHGAGEALHRPVHP
jgi:putative drug exporter of the RND superfamily